MSSTTDFLSFYIPYVPKHWDEDSMRRLFADLRIGVVDRVDFFDAGNWSQNGNWAWAFGAFVHMKSWAYSEYADWVYNAIETTGQWKLHIPNQPGKYFVLRKMTCEKIPSTHLNVHQLAAKMAEMEEELQLLRNETQLLKAGITATQMAEDVLRNNFEGELEENTDFYTKYENGWPLSMAEIADQSEKFDECCNHLRWRESDERSETSSQGSSSSAKRMRVSEELCGNN